jgi:hypothetical protein
MTDPGYYDTSYPPELWETPAAPVGAARAVPVLESPAAPAAGDLEAGAFELEPAPSSDPAAQVVGEAVELTPEAAAALEARGPLPELPASAYAEDAVPLEDAAAAVPVYSVSAGAPGSYSPAVTAAERPRNVTDLGERARPVAPFPWLPGQYVLVGERGKRAHWDGAAWRSGEAPQAADQGGNAPGTVPAGTVER